MLIRRWGFTLGLQLNLGDGHAEKIARLGQRIERLGIKIKRELRLAVLGENFFTLLGTLDDERVREGQQRKVREARVFSDAYFKAVDEHKNPMTAANARLRG